MIGKRADYSDALSVFALFVTVLTFSIVVVIPVALASTQPLFLPAMTYRLAAELQSGVQNLSRCRREWRRQAGHDRVETSGGATTAVARWWCSWERRTVPSSLL